MARNDAGLRWSAVTIESRDDAKNALDRITIPKEILDRIAATALPRSSIVVSDEPLSEETNYRTEFVAVLSDPASRRLHHTQAERSPHGGRQQLSSGRRRVRHLFPAQPKSATRQPAPGRLSALPFDAAQLVVSKASRSGRREALADTMSRSRRGPQTSDFTCAAE
jgi:hypothetical protein